MLGKLTSALRELGPAATAAYAGDRLLRRLSPSCGLYFYELMVQPVGLSAVLPAARTRQLAHRELRPGDADLQLLPVPEAVKQFRFAQGATCLGVYRKNAFIGYVWFCTGTYDEDEIRCTYDMTRVPASAWDFDLYLLPEHRMGTGFLAIWHSAFEHLRARAIERSYSRVNRFNLASRRAHARLGSTRVGRVLVLKLGAVQLLFSDAAPFVAVTWKAAQTVRLVVPDDRPEGGPRPCGAAP